MTEKNANQPQNKESGVRRTLGGKSAEPTTSGLQPGAANLQQALNDPSNAAPDAIIELQRIAGNQAVTRLIQAKLTVGAADDPYEREADQIAAAVIRMPDTSRQAGGAIAGSSLQRDGVEEEEIVQGKPLAASISRLVQRAPAEEEEVQAKPIVQRAPLEEEEVQAKAVVQRAPLEEEEVQAKPDVQRAPAEEEEVQAKPDVQRAPLEEEEVQAKPDMQRAPLEEEEPLQAARSVENQAIDPRSSFDASADVAGQLQAQQGSGAPLPVNLLGTMETRFGADFSQVHVHNDSQASQLNRALSAQAFTHGSDIYMGEGKYDPGSSAGQQLLAHELTHTIQQGASPVQAKPDPASPESE